MIFNVIQLVIYLFRNSAACGFLLPYSHYSLTCFFMNFNSSLFFYVYNAMIKL